MWASLQITTWASSRVIRQAFQWLLRSKSILSGYKIPYAKHYTIDEKARTVTTNIQILILVVWPTWEKSGKQILDNILKDWSMMDQ